MYDLKSLPTYTASLKSQAFATTSAGTGVDLRSAVGEAVAILACSAATAGTNPTLDVKIQDSADNSTFADVTGYTFTQVTNADSLQTLRIDPRLVRRYVRAYATIGGTSSPSFPVTALIAYVPQSVS
jgi:hypothetical protein